MRFQPRCQMKFKIFPPQKDFVAALSQKNGGKLKKRWNAWALDLFIKKGPYIHSLKKTRLIAKFGSHSSTLNPIMLLWCWKKLKKSLHKNKNFSPKNFSHEQSFKSCPLPFQIGSRFREWYGLTFMCDGAN